ncbi:MAG: deoxyribonuclease IV [Candidatus Thorarchaeota archaeon]|nr:deoxyribonuclease IV [Candidatus Thorarchaeota archaeon]
MGVHFGGVTLLNKVLFGPAGYPSDARGSVKRVFQILVDSGMTALEYAAVHGLRTSKAKAIMIGNLARESGVSMSLHAAYYISLASRTQRIRETSRERLRKALRFAPLMNVKRVVFHPGYLGGLTKEEAHIVIRDALRSVWETTDDIEGKAFLAPETAGKLSAYGSIDQIIRLCQDVEGCIPTIDWAHIYARCQGDFGEKHNYLKVLTRFENELGELFLKNMHFHVSGITFTEKGEAAHRPLGEEWGPDILPLLEVVRECGYNPTFISESTNPLQGALYAKYLHEELEKGST